jgi:hypothetical protein
VILQGACYARVPINLTYYKVPSDVKTRSSLSVFIKNRASSRPEPIVVLLDNMHQEYLTLIDHDHNSLCQEVLHYTLFALITIFQHYPALFPPYLIHKRDDVIHKNNVVFGVFLRLRCFSL